MSPAWARPFTKACRLGQSLAVDVVDTDVSGLAEGAVAQALKPRPNPAIIDAYTHHYATG